MKKIFLILIIILFVSCSKKKELQGFWYGKKVTLGEINDKVLPILLKFNNDNFIDYNQQYDTVEYKRVLNKIYTPRSTDEIFNYSFKIKDSTLNIFALDTGEDLNISLVKRKNSNFLFDFLDDKTLLIDLPNSKKYDETVGLEFNFSEPLYLTYKNNELISYLRTKTKLVDTNYYKFLLRETYTDLKPTVSLIADKNIKMSDLRLLQKQLKLANFNNVRYLMKSNEYDKAKTYSIRLQNLNITKNEIDNKEKILKYLDSLNDELTKKEVGYILDKSADFKEIELPRQKRSYTKKHSILLKIDRSDLILNNKRINLNKLKNIIQNRLEKDSLFYTSLYITDESTYQNYIDYLDVSYKVALDLQKKYLKEKYNLEKNPMKYSSEYREKIEESKRKFPFTVWCLKEAEYENLLQNFK